MNLKRLLKSNDNQSCKIHINEGVPFFTLDGFQTEDMIHGFSTRLGGVSEGIFSTMNLSFTRGDDDYAVMENYKRIGNAMGIPYEDLVFSDQTHTTNIHVVTKEDRGKGITYPKELRDVDGLVTNIKGLPLITFYADCVPLFFHDRITDVVALAHSGWKGTVRRIGQCMVETMKREYGCKEENIHAAIGPSICHSCYEISEDVATEFEVEFTKEQSNTFLTDDHNGKYHLDLWKVNEIILEESGIPKVNIITTDLCTCCNPDIFFSHRASHGKRGNLAAFIMLK